jgi:O-antigen/teichoic acid export membrane protein
MSGWRGRVQSVINDSNTHYLLGEVAAKGVSFGVFIVIARYLGATEFGWVSLYVSLSGLLAVAVGAGLPNAIVRFHFSDTSFSEVLGTTALGLLGAFVMIGGLSALLAPWLADLLGIPLLLFWWAIPGGIAISLRNAWLSSLRARKQSRSYTKSQFAEAALFALLTGGVLAVWEPDYRVAIAGYSGATAIVACFGVLRWNESPGLRINRRLFAPLFRFAIPMIFHAFAMAGLATYDQIILNQLVGPDAAGTYAFAYRFGMSMVILSTAFSSAWIPEFLDLVRDPNGVAVIRVKADRYVNRMIGAAIALMIALPPLVRILGGPGFADAPKLVPVIIYAYLWFVLYTLIFAHALHGGKSLPIAVTTFAALLINVALNYLLIPSMGLMGAALASVGGYAALFALQLAMHRHIIRDMAFPAWAGRVALAGLIPLALSRWFF